MDLSSPKDVSVTLGVDKNSYLNTDFRLSFPTVDTITDALKDIGPCSGVTLLTLICVCPMAAHTE